MTGHCSVAMAVAAALLALPAVAASPGIPAEWVGRYQAKVVSASSGMNWGRHDDIRRRQCAGHHLQCADPGLRHRIHHGHQSQRQHQRARQDHVRVSRQGGQSADSAGAGRHRRGPGRLSVNLKDGKQFRDWTFTGTVTPDGTVEINGIPDTPMDYLNTGKWEKHRPCWRCLGGQDEDARPLQAAAGQRKG